MKKSIVMLLLTITVLSLSACVSGKETDEKENVKQEAVDENVVLCQDLVQVKMRFSSS